jgi:excisionase family DNA binding protein
MASTLQLDQLLAMLDAGTRLVGADGSEVSLGEDVAEAFQAAIAEMRVREVNELSTQEAARMIGVSRPTLIRLLDSGAVAYRRTHGVRGHRRIARRDALTYLRDDIARRRKALDELAADAEAFGFFDN